MNANIITTRSESVASNAPSLPSTIFQGNESMMIHSTGYELDAEPSETDTKKIGVEGQAKNAVPVIL